MTNEKIERIPIENNYIIYLIRKLNPTKANGSDGISGEMLWLCDDSVILPLRIIFRNILSTAICPDIWKLANVTTIFKKGDKQLIQNYRPISLLPICGKIFEKIVFNNLYKHHTSHHFISKNQSGFWPGDLTTNQRIDLVNDMHRAFDNTKSFEVRAIFLDISNAFDKVWHDGLIFKMSRNGASGRLLNLFQNYLNNRKQHVVLNGYSTIKFALLQGSVLGPLLFLIYINDLERNIKSNVKIFADDTML